MLHVLPLAACAYFSFFFIMVYVGRRDRSTVTTAV